MSSGDTAVKEGGEDSMAVGSDFETIREKASGLIEGEERSKARKYLSKVAATAATRRTLEDNLWLYRILGWLNEDEERHEAAAEAYRRAYELDPTEWTVLSSLVEFVKGADGETEASWVIPPLQSVLVHHSDRLEDEERSLIHRRLGEAYRAEGDRESARAHFEQAMDASDGDAAALESLLEAMTAVGEPTDVVELRRKLIATLEESGERAEALVDLGDDWLERFNDPGRALSAYEDAVVEDATSVLAQERIASVASRMEDWERAYRAQVELSRMADDDVSRADRMVEAARIARDRLWEPEKALEGFRKVLELDPTRFDEAFKPITAILVDAEDWVGLEEAYRNSIERQNEREDTDPELLAVLLYKLGDVYRLHLDDVGGAIEAYNEASELFPENPEFHRQVAQLAENDAEYADQAIEHLQHLTRLDPKDADLLDRLGRAYLRRGDVDRALWHFRLLDFRGEDLGEKPGQFVQRFQQAIYKTPEHPLGEELRRKRIYPDRLDPNISRVFSILFPVLQDWTAERRSEYGLSRKDRVDPEAPLAFNNIYREIGESMELGALPELWRKSDQPGIAKASLADRALLVGDELFGSGDEKAIAFAVARKLILSLKPFFLVGLRRMSDLQAFFVLAVQLVQGVEPSQMSDHMQAAFKKIRKAVTGEKREALSRAIDAATDGGSKDIVLGHWTEAIEDAANRIGLVFCDDLEVCARHINNEPRAFSERTPADRIQALAEWSVSEDFLTLREELGISVSK